MFLQNLTTIIIFICLTNSSLFAISLMSENELKSQTAQAGISIAIDNAVFYNEDSQIKLIDDLNKPTPGYLNFKNVKTLTTYNTGNVDFDNDGIMGEILIDIASPSDPASGGYPNPYISIESDDFEVQSFIKIGELEFNQSAIGSMEIIGTGFPKWNLYFGGHGSGIDFETGFQLKVDSFKFDYGPEANGNWLGFQNLFIADSFSGIPENPSTWQPSGKFKLGNFKTNSPATFDIGQRATNDPTGSDTEPVIYISAPITGSLRIENIHLGNKDFGAVAIDGINIHRLTIEVPGRNLGNL